MWPSRRKGRLETPRRPPGQDRKSSLIPAPGGLEVVQAFINTLDVKSQSDELTTPGKLADWLSRNSLLPTGIELDASDLSRAQAVRSGLRAMMVVNSGGKLKADAVSGLDQAAIGARAQVRFDRDGTSRFELISRDFDAALGTLLGIVHVARSDGKWPAFKLCGHPKCRRAYFDFTKNLSGRWCTQRCGGRIRAQVHRQRKKR